MEARSRFPFVVLLALACRVACAHTDPTTHADHQRLLTEIFPAEAATNVAVTSGNWSEVSTWQDGLVPVASSRVHIPAGVAVTYDAQSNATLHWVRIDGSLSFSREVDTKLTVETMLVADHGHLEIGTRAAPLTTKATVEFRRISPTLHWSAIEVGLVVCGDFSVWGQPTTSWTRLATNPRRGATTLTLAQPATNWRVGDTLLVPGVIGPDTTLTAAQQAAADPDPLFREQHELRQIVALSGATITLSAPLTHDAHHQLPAAVTIAAGHLSRNIVLRSADATLGNRGHIMVMPSGHGKRYEVGYCSLVNLGRTRADTHVTDPQDGIPDSLRNPRGRYSLHFHKMAPDNHALVRGVAVIGSMKWAIVNHASVVDVEECISYDCDGAHFATETGHEKGSFVRNLGVYCSGYGRLNMPRERDGRFSQAEVNRIAPLGADVGFLGSGIWLQSPLVNCDENEMYGAFDAGLVCWTNHMVGTDHRGEPAGISPADLPEALAAVVPVRRDGKVNAQNVPFECVDNRSYGCSLGLEVYSNSPPDGFYSTFRGGGHYNVRHGINHWPQSANQLVDDVEFIVDPSLDAGVKLSDLYGGIRQFTFRNVRARNFANGINLPNFGANVVEGANTKLECQYNINVSDANAADTTVLRLAESNFGSPTKTGKPFSPAARMNIRLEVDTSPSFIRTIEWHRPGKPKLRLWSNPSAAPAGAFRLPRVSGVATEIP
jgi:hypothetical protein